MKNTVKAFPKKRKHQTSQNLIANIGKAITFNYQTLWYASFIAVYIWFLYWVAYDFFVWQKPIAEINMVNYIGAIAAIAFIWAGNRILKRDGIKATNPQQIFVSQKLTTQSRPQSKQNLPQKTAPVATPANSACAHYIGYLNQRQKSQKIPTECFTCEDVVRCMSSTN